MGLLRTPVITLIGVVLAGCNASYPSSPSSPSAPDIVGVQIHVFGTLGPVPVVTTFSLRAYAVHRDGGYEDVTTKTVWSTSDETVISGPSIAGGLARFNGVSPGTGVITAAYAGASHSITVETYRSDRLVYPRIIVSGTGPLFLGSGSTTRATFQRTANESLNVTTVAAWTTSDPAVATVTSDGIISARTPGTVLITASYLGVSGSYLVSVQPNR
jgi:hypothetical protein